MIAAHRRAAVTVVLTGTALALVACSGQTAGSPAPAAAAAPSAANASSSSGRAAKSDPLSSVDPCSLLPADELPKNGLTAGKADTEDGARACGWSQSANAFANTAGYAIGVRFYEHYGLDDVKARAGVGNTVTTLTVGSHDALQIKFNKGLAAGGCAVVLGVSPSSSAFVSAAAGDTQANACTDASGVATVVGQHLPAETK